MSSGSIGAISTLYGFYEQAKGQAVHNQTACTRLINHNVFFYWVLIPSAGIIITLMFFVKRVLRWPNILGGRPGILIPMNFLDDKGIRLSYAAVFGLTSSLCMKMILQEFPVTIHGPSYLKVLVKLSTMFLYGFALYPLLACLTLGTVLSFGIGTLYIWMFFIVNMINMTDCADDWEWRFYMQQVFLPTIPELTCTTFLTITFPYRFVRKLIKKIQKGSRNETEEFFEDSYQAKYVRRLMLPPVWTDEEKKLPLKKRLAEKIKKMTYTRVSGFRYSPRIISTYTAGIILLFYISFQFFSNMTLYLNAALAILSNQIDPNDKRSLKDVYENITFAAIDSDPSGGVRVLHHLLHTLLVIICVAATICSIIGIVQIAFGLRTYRDDLLKAYTGDFTKIGPCEGYASLTVAFVRYSGYQVAYIFWAFVLQFLVVFIVLFIGAYVIFIPVIFGRALWFFKLLEHYWPILAISFTISIISQLAARFIFLQERGRLFALTNRRLLFCVMYFLFFYQVFVGLFSCLLRMIKALGVGLLFLARLDSSTLPKKFEKMDPGFKSYVGLIHVENAHTHPVLVTFVNMIKEAIQERRDKNAEEVKVSKESYLKVKDNAEEGVELEANIGLGNDKQEEERDNEKKKTRRRKAMKAKWFLAYTLLNNLPLRAHRNHYLDAERERQRQRRKQKMEVEDLDVEVEDPAATDQENKSAEALSKGDVAV